MTAKKKKKVCNSVTYTTGDINLNIDRFNKAMGTDFNNPSTTDTLIDAQVSGEAALDGASEGGSAEGGFAEDMTKNSNQNLVEKRETKRYYVRPQDIFCANKADVLKALVTVADAGENCTVYSLKKLEDHDDVHQLTNNDIIYYYDDNVLYDKNHVIVMDYDLFIKHEEERAKLDKKPEAITKAEYNSNYDDRMTKETIVESTIRKGFKDEYKGYTIYSDFSFRTNDYVIRINGPGFDEEAEYPDIMSARQAIDKEASHQTGNVTESIYDSTAVIPFETFKQAIERDEEIDLGYNQDDADIMYVRDGDDIENYADTSYIAGKNNGEYYIEYTIHGDDGADGDSDTDYYQSFDELVNAIKAKD